MRVGALVVLLLAFAPPVLGQGLQIPDVDHGRLQADRVRYDVKAKVVLAEGNVRLTLGDVQIQAQRLRLEQGPQVAYAAGNVQVVQRETSLRTAELKYDLRSKVADATGGIKLVRKGSTLSGETMQANLRTQQADVKGKVTLVRVAEPLGSAEDKTLNVVGQQNTTITAPRIQFRWDANEAQAEGGVLMIQPDKVVRAQRVLYSESTGRAELVGDVTVEQLSGEWLVKGGLLDSPKDQETKRALQSKTILTCERLLILLKARDMEAQGAVTVTQKGRVATGERATYTSKDRRIVMTGNVRMREEDGSQLRADQVVIALVEETFEAVGNVETEFRVKSGK